MTVNEILREICQDICDDYCKYPEIYGADDAGRAQRIYDKCDFCPLNRLGIEKHEA